MYHQEKTILKYTHFIASDIGGRQENQDNYGFVETKFGALFIVCDGMGGANGGEIASELAVKTTIKEFQNSNELSPSRALLNAIQRANKKIWYLSNQNPNLHGMGTTIVALLINNEKAISCHVGDSRIYQIHKGNLVFKTQDHSKVFELVRRGIITEEQARLSDESNIILRALGTNERVDVEINENISFAKGDRFFLCTDGISGALPEMQLIRLINQQKSPEDTVIDLIQTINGIKNEEGGGHDNLTIGIVDLNFSSKLKPKTKMKTKIVIAVLLILLSISLLFNVMQCVSKINSCHIKEEKPEVDTLKTQTENNDDSLKRIDRSDTVFFETTPLHKAMQFNENPSDTINK